MKKNPYKKYIDELDTMSDEELFRLESKLTNNYHEQHVYQEYIDSIDQMNKKQLQVLKKAIIKFEQEDCNYKFVSKTNRPKVLVLGMFS